MGVSIIIQFNNKQLTIPVNPENLKITRKSDNKEIDVIGLGKTIRKGEPGLKSTTIESFFPGPKSFYYKGAKPKTCVDFINNIWTTENVNNNVAKIITIGLPENLNMFFVIQNFSIDTRAGEEDDVYFTLEISEYKPYGVKIIEASLSGLAAARAVSPVSPAPVETTPAPEVVKTYTVKRGDCLWNISKKYTGKGSRWPELYDLNRGVVGKNPNLIYPGQVLTLPNGW